MADKGHKALFNDSQVLISWGKEHHRFKKKKKKKNNVTVSTSCQPHGGHPQTNKCAFMSSATATPENELSYRYPRKKTDPHAKNVYHMQKTCTEQQG